MDDVFKLILASIFSSSVATVFVSFIFKSKTEKIIAEIKNQFEMTLTAQKTSHSWKEKAVSELYGPLTFHFSRTQQAMKRYKEKNLFLETKILKESNEKIRNLLLEKSYLIPPELINDANELVLHYDVWLEEFAKLRETDSEESQKNFVFVGPKGFYFPKNAEIKFKEKYAELWKNLYQ